MVSTKAKCNMKLVSEVGLFLDFFRSNLAEFGRTRGVGFSAYREAILSIRWSIDRLAVLLGCFNRRNGGMEVDSDI
jgi:hypothetical protein